MIAQIAGLFHENGGNLNDKVRCTLQVFYHYADMLSYSLLFLYSDLCFEKNETSEQTQHEKVKIEEKTFQNDTFEMAYLLYLPQDYDPEKSYRLILFMHGAGDRGFSFDMLRKIDYGFVTTFMEDPTCHDNTILLIPQCPVSYLWVEDSWTSGEYTMTNAPSPAIEAVKQLVDFVVEEYTVDKSLIYAVGVSMGGMAVWDMVARYTDFFAAVAPICGCLDESKIEEYLKTPIFTANDPRDTIVEADPTIRVTQELKARGADIVYKQYDTDIRNDFSYHSTWIDAFSLDKSEDNLYNFIFSYRRELEPEEDKPNFDTITENEQIDNTDRAESSKSDNETEEDEPQKDVHPLVVILCIIVALSIGIITPFVIRKILNDSKKD